MKTFNDFINEDARIGLAKFAAKDIAKTAGLGVSAGGIAHLLKKKIDKKEGKDRKKELIRRAKKGAKIGAALSVGAQAVGVARNLGSPGYRSSVARMIRTGKY